MSLKKGLMAGEATSRAVRLCQRAALAVGLGIWAAASATPVSAETREFMMKWFLEATNSAQDVSDCPQGLNMSPEEMFRAQLHAIGLNKDETENLVTRINGGSSPNDVRDAIVYRGRVDGKPMHAYTYPTSVPDLKLFHPYIGPNVYGFNLDGKVGPNDFIDPDTKEKGIDNAYARAVGCQVNQRGSRTELPTYGARHWDFARDKSPAWLVRVVADDFTKDGDVTVYIFRAMERAARDATGSLRRYWTFRRDPDVRWQNVMKGKIKDGVMYAEGDRLEMLGDPFGYSNFKLRIPHFRGYFTKDGGLEGTLGGYIPWKTMFFVGGSGAYNFETMTGTNVPALYYALKQNADATPDPKTGENTEISGTWRIDGIPAYIAESAQSAMAADVSDKTRSKK